MKNKTGAIGVAVGIAMGAAVGLAAVLIHAARMEEKERELRREEAEAARYRNPEYTQRAGAAISRAREAARAQMEDA